MKQSLIHENTGGPKVAYIMSRFPKLTETFVLYEILAVESEGVETEVYPLLREAATVVHPDAVPVVERAHFEPFLNARILKAQLHWLRKSPGAYLRALRDVLRGTWGSRNFFLGALGIFPKSAYFAQQMLEEGVQHVHAHFASHPAAAAFIIHRLAGLPYSFTAHGSDLHVERRMLPEKVAEAAFVVAVSDYNRQLIVDECGGRFSEKLRVIHCGVDTGVFSPRGGGERGPDRPFEILCTGTLHEVKGQRYLVEACALLRERGVAFLCHFAGDGPDRADLERQVSEAGLADSVVLHGNCTREQVAGLLGRADAVVCPSVPTACGKREGIPVVLMEAMGSGLPVIASGISGIPELVQDGMTGLLVPAGDRRSIADALVRLSGDATLRERLGAAGREKVLRDFDLFRNAAELAQEFRGATAVARADRLETLETSAAAA